jgi:hypothetical protein
VSVNGRAFRQDVAPPDSIAVRNSNNLRMSLRDVVEDELTRSCQRRRFKKCQVFPLVGNRIQRPMESIRVRQQLG